MKQICLKTKINEIASHDNVVRCQRQLTTSDLWLVIAIVFSTSESIGMIEMANVEYESSCFENFQFCFFFVF